MEPIEQIQHLFQQAIDSQQRALPMLPQAIAHAGMVIFNQLLQGHKMVICGHGSTSGQAHYFASLLLNGFERQRPGLPAIALGGDALSQTSAEQLGLEQSYARQLETLGQAGDVLILLTLEDNQPALARTLISAHEQEMPVILLSGGNTGRLHELLASNDVEIRAPADSAARIHELHLLTIHALCDCIDQQLFGN